MAIHFFERVGPCLLLLSMTVFGLNGTDMGQTEFGAFDFGHEANNLSEFENSTVSPHHTGDSVTETLRILATGDREIILDDDYRDIVLVLGNTGAGKSTITQFLAGNNSHLFSYEAEDGHFLIRDLGQKISFGTTLVSKSIYPELLIHPPTNTAFYDCPGFSDTRNASVEIANAFFIKKVADHAHRLKLLFIVNHSSLKSGQSRTDFKTLMEQSTILIKNTSKFRQGTALIATKVDSGRSTQSLINGVARFLTGASRDLATLLTDPNQLQQAQDLIDSFLVMDQHQNYYDRIGLFRQPDEVGPLSQIEVVQQCKMALEKIIFNNTQFVPKNYDDFKITVSDSAKLLVSNLGGKLNSGLSLWMSQLGHHFETEFVSKMGKTIMNQIDLLSELEKDFQTLQNLTSQLSTSQRGRDDFFNIFKFSPNNSETLNRILRDILLDVKKLDFLDQLEDEQNSIPIPYPQWLQPVTMAFQNISQEFKNFKTSINSLVTQSTVQIGLLMKQNFEQKIAHLSSTNVHELRHEFQNFDQKISTLITSLEASTDLKCFSTHLTSSLYSLGMATQQVMSEVIKISPKNGAPIIPLTAPYKLPDWLKGFEEVQKFLRTQNYLLSQKTNEAIQTSVDNLGAVMTRHFRTLNIKSDDNTQTGRDVLSKFSTDALIISALLGKLKQSKFLREFTTEIENGLTKLGVDVPEDFKKISHFYKNKDDLDLFHPISSKPSPFKPFEWIRPLETMLEVLHRQMADLSKAIEEQKRIAAEKATQQQIQKMHQETQRLHAAQEAAAKKLEEERLERQRLDGEREEKMRQDEIRRAAQKAEDDRQARAREAQILAAQQAREQALRDQMAQIQRALEEARNKKKRKWYQF